MERWPGLSAIRVLPCCLANGFRCGSGIADSGQETARKCWKGEISRQSVVLFIFVAIRKRRQNERSLVNNPRAFLLTKRQLLRPRNQPRQPPHSTIPLKLIGPQTSKDLLRVLFVIGCHLIVVLGHVTGIHLGDVRFLLLEQSGWETQRAVYPLQVLERCRDIVFCDLC